MIISDILSDEDIEINLKSRNKEDVIVELVQLINKTRQLDNYSDILSAVIEREKISSTGINNGIAIPHAKVNGISKIITGLGISSEGIDFKAMDHKPSHIFFLIISPKNDYGLHVKTLARITKILRDGEWKNELINCKSRNHIINFIKKKEQEINNQI